MVSILLDIIGTSAPKPKRLDGETIVKRNGIVRDIIIDHLDEEYHISQTNITHFSVRRRLDQLKMKEKERIHDLCKRLESIIR